MSGREAGPAARRWRAELAGWSIDPEILAGAPEQPWGATPGMFPPPPSVPPQTPARARALEALPPGGSVLDVGCGAGAAGLALAPPAGSLVGVDESPVMLAAFAEAAAARGVAARTVCGTWPDVAGDVGVADVVVCAHVAYNVADLAPFVLALGHHARRRVVLELTALHPLVSLAPLWEHFHHQSRPGGPSATLAKELLVEAGLDPREDRWVGPARAVPYAERLAFTRRRLCLPREREAEVAALMPRDADPHPRELVTLWWDTRAPEGG